MFKREIYKFMGLEKCVSDEMYDVANLLFNSNAHTKKWCIQNNNIEVLRWKYLESLTNDDVHMMCLYARRDMMLLINPEKIDSTCLVYALMSSNKEFFKWLSKTLFSKIENLENIIDIIEIYGIY